MRSTIAALCILALSACGGPPDAVRTTIRTTAVGFVEADTQLAFLAAEDGDQCVESSDTWEEYDACMQVWIDVERAMRATRASLYALEHAADAWDRGGSEEWASLAACAADSLLELQRALTAAEVDVPEEIATALGLVRALGGFCRD